MHLMNLAGSPADGTTVPKRRAKYWNSFTRLK